MDKRVVVNQVFRTLQRRNFAAKSQGKEEASFPPPRELITTTLENGMIVSSIETSKPLCNIGIYFRAGSRYETPATTGASHAIRSAVGLSTTNNSQFGLMRNIQQMGANLTSTGGRDHFAVVLQAKRNALRSGMEFLQEIAVMPAFKPWEVHDVVPKKIKLDLTLMTPEMKVLERLHKAAYRGGLANSIYSPKYLLDSHDSETLQSFVDSLCTPSRTAVVGVGIDHKELLKFADSFNVEEKESVDEPTKYAGGEIRKETEGSLAYVAIAGEGAGLKDKNARAFAVLQFALGTGAYVKFGSGAGKLSTALTAASNEPFAASSINVNYADSGLFGVLIVGHGAAMSKLAPAALGILKSGNVSDEEVKRGKAGLKAALLMSEEDDREILDQLGLQAIVTGKVINMDDVVKAIEAVTTAEVNQAATSVAGSVLSMAAYGDITSTPYLSDL